MRELSQARLPADGDPADPEHARLLSKEETEELAHFSHGNYAIAKQLRERWQRFFWRPRDERPSARRRTTSVTGLYWLTIATVRSTTLPATKGARDFAFAEARHRCCGRLSSPSQAHKSDA
jgi:hypothetical protein